MKKTLAVLNDDSHSSDDESEDYDDSSDEFPDIEEEANDCFESGLRDELQSIDDQMDAAISLDDQTLVSDLRRRKRRTMLALDSL